MILDSFSIETIRDRAHEVRCAAGAWLFRAGDVGDAMYMVKTGRLEVVTAKGDRVRFLGPGDVAGELALLGGQKRSASVRAVRDSILLRLSAEEFESLLMGNVSFTAALVRALGSKLRARVAGPAPRAQSRVIVVLALDREAPVVTLARAVCDAIGRAQARPFARGAGSRRRSRMGSPPGLGGAGQRFRGLDLRCR